MNSKAIGERTEGIILAHLLKKGYSVSIPFGNNQRYDMIVDTGERLLKVQCKTGAFTNGCVSFSTSSVNGFTGQRTNYRGQIDVFLVYCSHTDKVYIVPVDAAGKSGMLLRVDINRSGMKRHINWAENYLL
jgi:PD-(D/E)XK endonuclease